MKITYIVHNFPKASETFIAREVLLLRDFGQEVQCHAIQGPGSEEIEKLSKGVRSLSDKTAYPSKSELLLSTIGKLPDFFKALGLARKVSGGFKNAPNPYLLAARALWLAGRHKKSGADHLHAHWPYGSMLAWICHKVYGILFSMSIHAHEVAHENAHFPIILPDVQFAAFCNKAAMEYLAEQTDRQLHSRFHLIYHGVDLDRFRELPPPEMEGGIRILSAGRLTRTKGFDRLVKACALARKSGLNVSLRIFGTGIEESNIRKIAGELEFAPFLDLPGWVAHDELPSKLAEAHVVALLADTNYHDGLPNVIVEGMACGRPAIVSSLPAASELITSGENGFILDGAEDYSGFVAALRKLILPGAISSTGSMAAVTVRERYSDRKMIQKMIDCFIRATG